MDRQTVANRNTACIWVNLVGGPSQLDTWDMKPDAPREVRSALRQIRTNVSGIAISELFPRLAKHADKFSLVRTVHRAGDVDHETGYRQLQPGRLKSFAITKPPSRMTAAKDLERYGSNTFGRVCLDARQRIEEGERFVKIDMFRTIFDQPSWDMHGVAPFSSFECCRNHAGPIFDRAYSSLLEDLHDRGLLSTTMVIATGEFGRTPHINHYGGRDHWSGCWTALIGGGPLRCGTVVGTSDAAAAEPRDRPVTTAELTATVEHGMGIPTSSHAHPIRELFR